MESFEKIIGASPKDVRKMRVNNTVRNTAAASKAKIEVIKQEFRDIQSKIESLLDISILTSDDLGSNLKDFEPTPWCDQLYDLGEKLALKAMKLKIMINIHNKLFDKDQVEELSDLDLEFINNTTGLNINKNG